MSFFTTPASQRKRKRGDTNDISASKKRSKGGDSGVNEKRAKTPRARRDESIESSESDAAIRRNGLPDDQDVSDDESGDENETGAERRLLLAEKYLQNLKGQVEDEVGFDAADVDRDLLAERLQEDVAETQGRLFREIANTLDFTKAIKTPFRYGSLSTTSCATCPPCAYTVSKDMQFIKWELARAGDSDRNSEASLPPENKYEPPFKPMARRRPFKLIATKGSGKRHGDASYQHHTRPILCVAASTTGKFVATGGADKRLIIWSASDLKPLRVFNHHRDAVTSLAFRRGTNQLYSCSADRTIKTWSLDELAYVETLFGHQDSVVDVAALAMERCVSVGARDRSARLWKVVEETQLVFRAGGGSEKKRPKEGEANSGSGRFNEGSVDRVALVMEDTFVTGSDNGSISLWSLQKKKPIFTIPLAHGRDPALKPEEVSADVTPNVKIPDRQPRWITALTTVPFSDLVISGSWDGCLRIWRVTADKKRLEGVGIVGRAEAMEDGVDDEDAAKYFQGMGPVGGYVNDLSVFERGERGKDGLCIVAAIGKEPRLGAWKKLSDSRNGAVVIEIRKVVGQIPNSIDTGDKTVQKDVDASIQES